MNKSLLTTVVTSAVLVGVIGVLSLPYLTDAQASSRKGKSEHEYRDNRSSSSYEREDDDDDEREYRSGRESEHEEEHEYANYRMQVMSNENLRNECGECHVAYPPGMLPASSWQVVMAELKDHFGVDASIDPQLQTEITTFLVAHAGPEPKHMRSAPPLRISETAWFKDEHDEEEVPASMWQHEKVKSAANCEACHLEAAQGDYSEDNIRLPK